MTGRVAIYTCIIGAYDELVQPAVTDAGFDFICFVGKGEKTADRAGVWEIRELDCGISDPHLLSRYPKMHPHILLPDYDASLWIDGNIAILDDSVYRAVRIKMAAGVGYSGVTHPQRDCVYAEARKCRDMRYLSNFGLLRVWAWLFLHGVRRHSGLMENNLIFRRHLRPEIVALDELWWDRLLHLSRRDQLSFMWCLKKCGIRRDYLLPPGQSARNHPGFKYLRHK